MEHDPLAMFVYALRAPETRRQYPKRLKIFFDYLELKGSIEEQAGEFVVKARKDNNWAFASMMHFMSYQKERAGRGEISEATVPNYYKAVKLFCEMNDIILGWKKISRGMPKGRRSANDRAPTIEEIRKLAEYPDRRIKPIVYVMASSGIRLGAWDYLKWGHTEPVIENGKVLAAKMTVYVGDADEYLTLITPEAYKALKEWMDFREQSGERITKDSWVMRDLWWTERRNHGMVSYPKKLKSTGIKRMIERALWSQGIRKPLETGEKRHEFKADHGFRKFFKTHAEQVMRPINVEILMGHSTGISDSYYRPTEKQLIDDYLKAMDMLTISKAEELERKLMVQEARFEKKVQDLDAKLNLILGRELTEVVEALSPGKSSLESVVSYLRKELGGVKLVHYTYEEEMQEAEQFIRQFPDVVRKAGLNDMPVHEYIKKYRADIMAAIRTFFPQVATKWDLA